MDDLISRQDAIDAIKEFKHGAAEWKDEQEEHSDIWHRADSAIASAIEIGLRVKKIPSAQKKGHWIDTNPDEPLDPRQTCSECGNTEILHSANFCPNCGADMRGEDDG